ncbi:MAG: universal stress protein [Rhodovibrionaceae bacterium]
MPKKILLPVDGSDHAHKAAAFAGDLAEKYGCEIVLLHVVQEKQVSEQMRRMAEVEHVGQGEPPSLPRLDNIPGGVGWAMDRPAPATVPDDSQLNAFVNEKIVEEAREILKRHGAQASRALFKNGSPAQQILDAAKEEQADTIVMGSSGVSDLKGLIAGSVSHKVAQLADCTCITVK